MKLFLNLYQLIMKEVYRSLKVFGGKEQYKLSVSTGAIDEYIPQAR
jgi:hypothetical protein